MRVECFGRTRLSISIKFRVTINSHFSCEHKFKSAPRSTQIKVFSMNCTNLPSNGLRHLESIEGRSLGVSDDNKALNSFGLCARGHDLSGNDNRAVKKLGDSLGTCSGSMFPFCSASHLAGGCPIGMSAKRASCSTLTDCCLW